MHKGKIFVAIYLERVACVKRLTAVFLATMMVLCLFGGCAAEDNTPTQPTGVTTTNDSRPTTTGAVTTTRTAVPRPYKTIGTPVTDGSLVENGMKVLLNDVQADDIRYSKGTVDYEIAVIERDGKFGAINDHGELVLPIEYYMLELQETQYGAESTMLAVWKETDEYDDYAYLEKDGSFSDIEYDAWGYDSSTDVYWRDGAPEVWNRTDFIVGSTFEVYERYWHPQYNMLGTIALKPNTVVPVQHICGVTTNEDGEYIPEFITEKYALMDFNTRTLLTDFVYDGYSNVGFSEGVIAMKKGDRWGYVNEQGEAITPFEYELSEYGTDNRWTKERMYAATNGYIVVKKDGRFGLIDLSGKTILPAEYEALSLVKSNRRLWFKKDGSWSLGELQQR